MRRTRRVAVIIDSGYGYGRGLLLGIAKYSGLHGHWELCTPPPFYMETGKERVALDWLRASSIDGVIIDDVKDGKAIAAMGLPAVVHCDRRDEGLNLSYMDVDDIKVGKMAAEYFIDRGFKQLAYCGFFDFVWEVKRLKGFETTGSQLGCQVYHYEPPESPAQRLWGKDQSFVVNWLGSLPKPVGIMASNDDRARQVIDACKAADLLVPEEIAVLGVGNDELVCSMANPALSSINTEARNAGFEVAELLDKLMSKGAMANTEIIVMPTHVVTRQSTDIMAISDREVATALRFIRDHGREPIQVADVAKAVALTSHTLQRRFRSVLNRSIHDEISHVRMEYISRLLTETDLPISQIASDVGCSSVGHLARSFSRIKKMTPLAYRKKYGPNVSVH